VEKEKKKKRMLKYLQQLQDEMLEEKAEGFQVAGSKYRKLPLEMRRSNSPLRKLKRSNKRSTIGVPQSR